MRAFLLSMLILGGMTGSAATSQASLVQTKFKVRVVWNKTLGSARNLPSIRMTATYDTSAMTKCRLEIGKNDALSLWTETESFVCGFVKLTNAIVIPVEAIQGMVERSWVFTASKLSLDEISEVFATPDIHGTYASRFDTLFGMLGAQVLDVYEPTHLSIRKRSSFAAFELTAQPVATSAVGE